MMNNLAREEMLCYVNQDNKFYYPLKKLKEKP